MTALPHTHTRMTALPYTHTRMAALPPTHTRMAALPHTHTRMAALPHTHTRMAALPHTHTRRCNRTREGRPLMKCSSKYQMGATSLAPGWPVVKRATFVIRCTQNYEPIFR